jgi:hypothetical protein
MGRSAFVPARGDPGLKPGSECGFIAMDSSGRCLRRNMARFVSKAAHDAMMDVRRDGS